MMTEKGYICVGAGENIDKAYEPAIVEKDGVLYIYYGCADTYVGVATATLDEVLAEMRKEENRILR